MENNFTWQSQKAFLVYSRDEDPSRLFAVWKQKDGSIHCFEDHEDDNANIYIYNTIEDFIESITWYDWIINGIKDEELKKLVLERKN